MAPMLPELKLVTFNLHSSQNYSRISCYPICCLDLEMDPSFTLEYSWDWAIIHPTPS